MEGKTLNGMLRRALARHDKTERLQVIRDSRDSGVEIQPGEFKMTRLESLPNLSDRKTDKLVESDGMRRGDDCS